MNQKKGIDVTGKFGASFSSLGRDFQASGRIYSNVGDAAMNLIKTLGNAAEFYKQERSKETPEEREFKIKTERDIDATIATHAAAHRYKPDEFLDYTTKQKDKFLENIPEEHYDWASEIYEKRINGYYSTINNNKLLLDRQTQLSNFMQTSNDLRDKAMIAASNGDMLGAAEYTVKWRENEEFMFKNGFMDGVKKETRDKDFTDDTLIQQHIFAAKQSFGNDEQLNKLLEKVEKSNNYTPEQKHSIKQNILSEHNSWQATNRIKSAELYKTADFGIEAYAMGIEPQGFDFNDTYSQLKAAGNNEKAEALQQAYFGRKEMTSFAKLSPLQMSEEINDLKKTAKDENDLKRIKNFERLAENANKQIEADPLAYAIQHGVVADNGLDMSKPETFAVRKQNAAFLKEKYGLADAPVITKAEEQLLSSTIERNNPQQNAALVGTIYSGFGDSAGHIFRGVSSLSPEFAHAASVFGNNPAAAIEILEGMDIVKNEPIFLPSSEADFDTAFYKQMGNSMFADMTPEWISGLKKTVKSSLASHNKRNNDTSRVVSEDRLENAFNSVVGEVVDMEIDIKGSLNDNEYKVPAPLGVSSKQFTDWYLGLTDKDIPEAVTFSGLDVSMKRIQERGTLHYAGNGFYRVRINGELIYTTDGKPLVLQYKGE